MRPNGAAADSKGRELPGNTEDRGPCCAGSVLLSATLDRIGKPTLYQLSYVRICPAKQHFSYLPQLPRFDGLYHSCTETPSKWLG